MRTRRFAAATCSLLVFTAMTSCRQASSPSTGEEQREGETPRGKVTVARSWPSEAELTEFALGHVERLGLLAGTKDREEFAALYPATVMRASLCHPKGAWRVSFRAGGKDAVRVHLSSDGQLLGFSNYWPGLSAQDAQNEGEAPEPIQEAVARSIEAIKSLWGDLPDDLVLDEKEAVLQAEKRRGFDVYYRTPYWDFRWRQYDGDIKYANSWVRVVISKRDGVVGYKNQYLGLKTRHTVKISREEALARTRRIVEETVLPGFTDVADWGVGCGDHPEAYVWKLPGSEGDFLAYLCGWSVNGHIGMFFLDATTGQKVGVSMTPSVDWAIQREAAED